MVRTRILLVLGCLGASFLGGAAASLLLRPRVAEAQERKPEKVVKAQRFELVDENDMRIGFLGFSTEDGPTLELGDLMVGARLNKEGLWLSKGATWTHIRYDEKAKRFQMRFAEGEKGVVWTQP